MSQEPCSLQVDDAGKTLDECFDVVVIGYGFAGGASAIACHDAGLETLLIEKMPDPGGISITAGGGIRIAEDEEATFEYLKATNDGRTGDAVLRVFAHELTGLEDYLRGLAANCDAKVVARKREGNYAFPGFESLGFIEIESIPGFDPIEFYPQVRGRLRGPILFRVVQMNVQRRGIEVRLQAPAERLLRGPNGDIRGVVVRQADGTVRRIGARRGVVLACGGFEASPELQAQYWQLQPVMSAVSRGNTGDGIRMAQDVGAALWHMWHFHGSLGFRHPDPSYPCGIRMKRLPDWTPSGNAKAVPMSWILLDKHGTRFCNEYAPYAQDTGHRDVDVYDPVTQSFPRIPAFCVVDDDGRQLYPLGQAVINDREAKIYDWSADNLQEVDTGILQRVDSVAELAGIIGCDAAILQSTLDDWNHAIIAGEPDALGRPEASRVAVRRPPFYVGEVYPVVSNTQGGPVHDEHWRVLNSFGEPIARLYEAGELGSIWGSLYLGGGNLSECFVSGRIVARELATLEPWPE